MSNVGVDLLRSDTGHYMQWPTDEELRVAPPAVPAARHAQRGRTWITNLEKRPPAPVAVAPIATRAIWIADTRSRVSVGLALVNWLFLLLMFCAFLLAKTLPVDTALTGGAATQACAPSSSCAQAAGR